MGQAQSTMAATRRCRHVFAVLCCRHASEVRGGGVYVVTPGKPRATQGSKPAATVNRNRQQMRAVQTSNVQATRRVKAKGSAANGNAARQPARAANRNSVAAARAARTRVRYARVNGNAQCNARANGAPVPPCCSTVGEGYRREACGGTFFAGNVLRSRKRSMARRRGNAIERHNSAETVGR